MRTIVSVLPAADCGLSQRADLRTPAVGNPRVPKAEGQGQ